MSPPPRPGTQGMLLLALPALLAGLVGVALWGRLLVHPTLLHIDEAWVWASSHLGSLPFGDGWRGTDRVDRLLPPLHSWLSRAMGGGLPAIRLASLLEGCLAASLTALWARLVLPGRATTVTAAAVAALLLWHTPFDGATAGTAWGGFATSGRYDMAGMLLFAGLGAAAAGLERAGTRRAAGAFGLLVGLGLLAHGTLVATAAVALPWGLWRAGAHRRAVLGGLALGGLPLALWLAVGGAGSLQLLAQLDRADLLVAGAVATGARWQPLAQAPTLGGALLLAAPLCALVLRPRAWVGWSVVGSWLLTELLSGQSGGNYALVALPGCVTALAILAASGPRRRWLAGALAAALCVEGLVSASQPRALPVDTRAQVQAALPDGARVLVNLRNLPAVEGHDALLPFFVMQWHARPEDERSLAQRLDAWCPDAVVTNRGDWPFALVRPQHGGPALEAWLAQRVTAWTEPAPGLRVGRVAGCRDPLE